ncbi:MAG: hypothetical protein M3Y30_07470 [Gemmatimonadota bacterium]|nr:hypothetical protein [Gemmatimonadota bacterium]
MFTIGGTPVTLTTNVIVGFILLVAFIASRLVHRAARVTKSELNEAIWWAANG